MLRLKNNNYNKFNIFLKYLKWINDIKLFVVIILEIIATFLLFIWCFYNPDIKDILFFFYIMMALLLGVFYMYEE